MVFALLHQFDMASVNSLSRVIFHQKPLCHGVTAFDHPWHFEAWEKGSGFRWFGDVSLPVSPVFGTGSIPSQVSAFCCNFVILGMNNGIYLDLGLRTKLSLPCIKIVFLCYRGISNTSSVVYRILCHIHEIVRLILGQHSFGNVWGTLTASWPLQLLLVWL